MHSTIFECLSITQKFSKKKVLKNWTFLKFSIFLNLTVLLGRWRHLSIHQQKERYRGNGGEKRVPVGIKRVWDAARSRDELWRYGRKQMESWGIEKGYFETKKKLIWKIE